MIRALVRLWLMTLCGCAQAHTLGDGAPGADAGGLDVGSADAGSADGALTNCVDHPNEPCAACLVPDTDGWCWGVFGADMSRYRICADDGTCSGEIVECPHGPCQRARPSGLPACDYRNMPDEMACLTPAPERDSGTCQAGVCVPRGD
jgi:hypothetical protein